MRPLFSLPLPDALVASLAKSGYNFLEDLTSNTNGCQEEVQGIINSFGLSWEHIVTYAKGIGSVSVTQLLRKEQLNEFIPTFSETLDELLGGGVQTDSLLQVCGLPGTGKTQLGLQLSVSVQIPVSLGGLGAESVFIDTEGTFSLSRIKEIASAASGHCSRLASSHGLDVNFFTIDYILSRIHFIDVRNLLQLISCVQRLKELLQSNLNIKLIVIDSIIFPFLKIIDNLERTRNLSILVKDLEGIASNFNLSVVINNHLTTKMRQEGKVLAPGLGESFSHLTPSILLLGSTENLSWATMYKGHKSKVEKAYFKICAEGIRDS